MPRVAMKAARNAVPVGGMNMGREVFELHLLALFEPPETCTPCSSITKRSLRTSQDHSATARRVDGTPQIVQLGQWMIGVAEGHRASPAKEGLANALTSFARRTTIFTARPRRATPMMSHPYRQLFLLSIYPHPRAPPAILPNRRRRRWMGVWQSRRTARR